ncbi:MAG: hypothetical protein ACFFDT_06755 [Candidatus Hodarchaeota archaeon]
MRISNYELVLLRRIEKPTRLKEILIRVVFLLMGLVSVGFIFFINGVNPFEL